MCKFTLSAQWKAPYVGCLFDDDKLLEIRFMATNAFIEIDNHVKSLNVYDKSYDFELKKIINCIQQLKYLVGQCDWWLKGKAKDNSKVLYTSTMANEADKR